MRDIDRARELSDAAEIERIHGGEEPERKQQYVKVEFLVDAHSKDDAMERITEYLPELMPYRSAEDQIDWEILEISEE